MSEQPHKDAHNYPDNPDPLNKGAYKVYVDLPPSQCPQFVPDSVVLMNDRLMKPPADLGYTNRLTIPSGTGPYYSCIPR